MVNHDILESIMKIDEAIDISREKVCEAMSNVYEKSTHILEYYTGDQIDQFSIFQEDGNETAQLASNDVSFMTFDNSNIIEAIKYFNEARAKILDEDYKKVIKNKTTLSTDIKKIVHTPEWKAGIEKLNQQFNCKLHISHLLGVYLGTSTFPSVAVLNRRNITVSKSKGFQLNGLHMLINIGPDMSYYIPKDPELFGQFITGIILHEIFHNISYVFRSQGVQITSITNSMVSAALSATKPSQMRIVIQNYVDTICSSFNIKLNRKNKKSLVKKIIGVVATGDKPIEDGLDIDEQEKINHRDVRRYKNRLNKIAKEYKSKQTRKMVEKIFMILGNTLGVVKSIMTKDTNTFFSSMMGSMMGIFSLLSTIALARRLYVDHKNVTSKDFEEYYCDLFAAMYKLPIVFRYNFRRNKKIIQTTANAIDKDDLIMIHKAEALLSKTIKDSRPTDSERNYIALKVSKNILENDKGGNLDPSIKKYLQWIIDNFSNVGEIDIDNRHDNRLFDPKEADDIDKHIAAIIDKTNMVVTESDLSWIFDDVVVFG